MKLRRWQLRDRHHHLLAMIREHWTDLALAALCMLVMSACKAATAYLVKPAVDEVFISRNAMMLKLIPFATLLVFLVNGVSMYGEGFLMNRMGRGIVRQFRNLLYAHIQDLPLSFFHMEKTGVLMSRIINDVNIVKTMVSSAVTASLRDIFTVVGLIGLIFYLDWKMASLAFVALPLAFYPLVEFGRRIRRISTRGQEAMAEMSAFLHETFAGAKIVKAFGMEDFEKRRFFAKTERLYRIEMKEVRVDELTSPVMEFIGGLGIAASIFYGGFRVFSGDLTPGTFFSFVTGTMMLYAPVKKLSKVNNAVQRGLAATDRIFEILERRSEIREIERPVTLAKRPHTVRFEHVGFAYGGDGAPQVLQDINLEARAGEVIALVGMSGGGKTSLVNLIPRFFDVTAGAIRIDGVDIRNASLVSLREQIAIVTQEPILFNETVRDNIAYGNPQASEADIQNAARAAYAWDFIASFPKGFDTLIGELGGRLSGGEKQRLCIARALLKDAPILILDEATSALDSESEILVQKALENLMRGRTTFIIAHRLSTIAHAHRIVVLVKGRIVEEGRHEDLLGRDGEYRKLYQMQFSDGEAPGTARAVVQGPSGRD